MRRLAAGDRLAVATHNPGKLVELDALIRPYGVNTCSAASLGLPEPDETEPEFAGNARLKAAAAAAGSGLPALADDSGFCVAALSGAPGILSARWAGPDKNFAAAMHRIATKVEGPDRGAWFVCALCLAWPDGQYNIFIGRVDGSYIWPPRGENGFGYDAMFVPGGASLSYGEMAREHKEADNHRARAFARFAAACLPLKSQSRADP